MHTHNTHTHTEKIVKQTNKKKKPVKDINRQIDRYRTYILCLFVCLCVCVVVVVGVVGVVGVGGGV